MRKRDDLDRGVSRGGWALLALLCACLGCLNPRPEELPSNEALDAPPAAEPAPADFAAPTAAGATGPADELAPQGLPEDAPEGPDQARRGLPPPDAGAEADAGADAGAD